jgi:hypothetical protein
MRLAVDNDLEGAAQAFLTKPFTHFRFQIIRIAMYSNEPREILQRLKRLFLSL